MITERTHFKVNNTMSLLVLQAKEGFVFINYFLTAIFLIVIFFLGLLSIMLIYSLMVADVDSK